jgi:hypothetical protein
MPKDYNGRTYTEADLGNFTIELDCEPGPLRPGDLLPGVLHDTPLHPEDFFNTSRVFGNWRFVVRKQKEAEFESVRPTIEKHITLLHSNGVIRYGSW